MLAFEITTTNNQHQDATGGKILEMRKVSKQSTSGENTVKNIEKKDEMSAKKYYTRCLKLQEESPYSLLLISEGS